MLFSISLASLLVWVEKLLSHDRAFAMRFSAIIIEKFHFGLFPSDILLDLQLFSIKAEIHSHCFLRFQRFTSLSVSRSSIHFVLTPCTSSQLSSICLQPWLSITIFHRTRKCCVVHCRCESSWKWTLVMTLHLIWPKTLTNQKLFGHFNLASNQIFILKIGAC